MFWLQIVSNFIKILREGQTPAQVAGGFALGALVGLSPSLTLQGLVIWLIIFTIDVNLSAAFLAFTLFGLLGALLDPLFHIVGTYLLVDVESLHGAWTALYNAPIAPLTRFNNTVVIGSFVSALIVSIPLYVGMRSFVVAYRSSVGAKMAQWRIYQVVSKSALVRWYQKLRDFGGMS